MSSSVVYIVDYIDRWETVLVEPTMRGELVVCYDKLDGSLDIIQSSDDDSTTSQLDSAAAHRLYLELKKRFEP